MTVMMKSLWNLILKKIIKMFDDNVDENEEFAVVVGPSVIRYEGIFPESNVEEPNEENDEDMGQ